MNGTNLPFIHVDVLLNETCVTVSENLKKLCYSEIGELPNMCEDAVITHFKHPELKQYIRSMSISLPEHDDKQLVNLKDSYLHWHFYLAHSDDPSPIDLETDSKTIDAATHWMLPSTDFIGLWENLVFDVHIKTQLLNYVSSSLLFSEKNVDWNIVPWNKVILLYGPPGTGKTSLCKALAQKICIRFSDKYSCGYLLEINTHSLFSKWFSESGKLVANLFRRIEETVADTDALVVLLIDEVESLAHSRKASFDANSEPSDSIRVVNALLTHLDRIRRYPNVLILTTSNMTEAIDLALVDRADIKQYIGLPSAEAIYQIYCSCIKELQRVGIIYTVGNLLNLTELKKHDPSNPEMASTSNILMNIAKNSVGLSGRAVRKLTLMSHALHVQHGQTLMIEDYLQALAKTVKDQIKVNNELSIVTTKLKEM